LVRDAQREADCDPFSFGTGSEAGQPTAPLRAAPAEDVDFTAQAVRAEARTLLSADQ